MTHSAPEAAFLGQGCLVLSARPGQIREYVDIGFASRRTLAMRDTLEFVQVAVHLGGLSASVRSRELRVISCPAGLCV